MSEPDAADIRQLQHALVDKLVKEERLTNPAVETAFRTVPRHLFLPDTGIEVVYQDDAIATKHDELGVAISSSSQPAIMAIMLEQLELQPGQNVLEIGAGTGYNAALMGHLVGEHGRVTTLDIDQDIVDAAQAHLAAAGCHNVMAVCGDGMEGHAANAPYDRIILTVGAWEIAPAWMEQMQPDGRLLLPLSLNGPQFSIAFEWQNDHLISQSMRDCGFMRLRGPHAGPDKLIPIDPDNKMFIGYEENLQQPRSFDGARTYAWLTGTFIEAATGIQATPQEAWRGLMFWLALHEPNFVYIHVGGELVAHKTTPLLFGMNGNQPWGMSIGILNETGLAAVVRPSEHTVESGPSFERHKTFDLHLRQYGDDDTAVQQLQDHLHNWDKAGRPNSDHMVVSVFPINSHPAADIAISRRWHTFVVWQPPKSSP